MESKYGIKGYLPDDVPSLIGRLGEFFIAKWSFVVSASATPTRSEPKKKQNPGCRVSVNGNRK